MRPSERIARLVVEAAVPGATLEYRPEQSHGECDFILHFASGGQSPLEVTESVDQNQRLIYDKILSKKEGGQVIETKKCHSSWAIVPAKDARIAKIRAKADDYLSALEKEGIESFICWTATTQTVERVCRALLLENGRTISTTGPARIWIFLPGEGGAVGPSLATAAAEKEAHKSDNRRKLGAANAEQRHLVVYVDVTNGLPWVALTDFEPPSTLPKLPQEITHIWLIGHCGETNKNEFVVWRASTKEPWYSQRVVAPEMIAATLGIDS